jgi:hypothetical protein
MGDHDNNCSFRKLTEKELKELEYMRSYFSYMIGEDEEVLLMDRIVVDKDDVPVLIATHVDAKTREVKRSRMATVEDVNQVVTFVRDNMEACFEEALRNYVKGQIPLPGAN